MSDGEIDLWSRLSSKKLIAAGKAPTSHEEMLMFAACLLTVTQAPKKGGIIRAFDENDDGLFPAPSL
eukprot:11893432-Ditylum_brightwellii.AAC.1